MPGKIYTSNFEQENRCPNNEGYVWSWNYYDGTLWIDTDDVKLKCIDEDDFCTSGNPCGTDQGDCDTHDECQSGLRCGTNNCPDSLNVAADMDCCYNVTNGDENFCTVENPCGVMEGDCDFYDECQTGLECDTSHSCPTSLGFHSNIHCCTSCHINWIGDSYCDPENNKEECDWDGGDCCGNLNYQKLFSSNYYCSECECLDPNY